MWYVSYVVRMVASSSELLCSPSDHNSTHSIGQETKMKIASLIKIYLFFLRTSRTGEITTIWVSLDSLLPRLRARLHPSLDFHRPPILPSCPGRGLGSLSISRY